ncbi:MAG: hypothetical protein JXB15_00450 [Anaerolineales bacterium]|nr:hypothetical protein [Anaerolineales bacterium]
MRIENRPVPSLPKIVIIGASSASFGLNTLASLLRSPNLRSAHLALVGQNAAMLALVERAACRPPGGPEAPAALPADRRSCPGHPGGLFANL